MSTQCKHAPSPFKYFVCFGQGLAASKMTGGKVEGLACYTGLNTTVLGAHASWRLGVQVKARAILCTGLVICPVIDRHHYHGNETYWASDVIFIVWHDDSATTGPL